MKYIIETDDTPVMAKGEDRLYRVKGLENTFFWNDTLDGLEKLDGYIPAKDVHKSLQKSNKQGFDKGYEAGKCVAEREYERGYETAKNECAADMCRLLDAVKVVFPAAGIGSHTPEEIIEMAGRAAHPMTDGDVVKRGDAEVLVLLARDDGTAEGIALNDVPYVCERGDIFSNLHPVEWEYTGRHMDVRDAVGKILGGCL